MTIMVAGGLTFAIPGMEPAQAAQISSNPNLKVSAEGQNADNEIAATNIIEVLVIDRLIDDIGDAEPQVTVDGTKIGMYQSGTGAWYSYFADEDIPTELLDDCKNIPKNCDVAIATSDSGTTEKDKASVKNAPPRDDRSLGDNKPTLYFFDLDGKFDVVYESPNGDQTVTLDMGNPDSGVSLDRTTYPRNTDVVVTIDDQALNVDPTSEDEWFLNTDGHAFHRDEGGIVERVQAEAELKDAKSSAATTKANALASAITPGDAEITALEERNRVQGIAKAAIDNILIPDDSTEGKAARVIYGDGTRDQPTYDAKDYDTKTDKYTGDTDDVNFMGTAQAEYLHAIATAQSDYDHIVGVGQKDQPTYAVKNYKDTKYTGDTDDVNFMGTAQAEYLHAIASAEATYVGIVGIVGDNKNNGNASPLPTISIDGIEPFDITDAYDLLECADTDCGTFSDAMWVKFTEDGDNDSNFTNSPDDTSSLKTKYDAQRGLSFSVEYDNSVSSSIGYSTTNIVIDAGDEWNSGEEIAITLTDSDANTNSLSGDDLDVTNSDQIIPTIEIGDPFTLGHLGYDETSKSVTLDAVPIATQVTEVSDILVFKGTGTYGKDKEMNIDLGTRKDVNKYLPENHQDFKGMHILNYDVSALENVKAITLKIEGEEDLPLLKGGGSGTHFITDTTFDPNVKLGDDATPEEKKKKAADQLVAKILYDDENNLKAGTEDATLVISFDGDGKISEGDTIIIDIFAFGLEDTTDPTSNVNDAIYRLELEEDGDNSSDFTGTLEYIGLNQINILDTETYTGIETISDSIILISDDDSISVEYLDLDSTGGTTLFTAEADTPTHSGLVKLDSDGYKVADTVTVTVTDADLNVDSGKADVYTTYGDMVGSKNGVKPLLTVSIDGEKWAAGCKLGEGLNASEFTLRETGSDTGVFTGTFAVPKEHCPSGSADAVTVTGTDISVEYVDFRDDSGSLISVSASAGIRSNTGSVSLDRTVYPVPIGEGFETHGDKDLSPKALTVYVSINDSDFDTSSNGIDSISADLLKVQILRGSDDEKVTLDASTISETAPDSGIFELTQTISYNDGVSSDKCPRNQDSCILQGDILHVEYNDPSDASGSANSVTDSATFDLRNAVLQSDQTVYVIGTDAIVTLIEPDLNLDSDSTETYTLDLIEWDSDAGTEPLGDPAFDATPSNLLETGSDTGIFQVVISVPNDIDEDRLERGEEITLTYNDWSPSGADHVGDKDEEITATIYTSNFGATIELDQRVYTWTDKVYITVVAPDHNIDGDQVDEIGNNDDYPIRISTRGYELEEYKLVETGADTGIFTGEIILTGFSSHDADGDGNDGDALGITGGTGPTDGQIRTDSESGISASFKFSEGETVSSSALIRWNVGEVQWLEASYPASGSGIVRIIDPDMNLNPEAVDNFDVTVWSDTDGGGIDLTVTETNAATGIFEGTVFFGVGVDTSGHRLRVVEGDTVTAQYYDNTLPAPFKETERLRIGATTLIGTIVPPLERAPISDLRAVDSFGNTLDVISVDSQIQLESDITNGQDKSQEFAYLIQVQDDNGVTVSLNWITGSLTPGQSLSPAVSWTPTEAGTYDVTAFVWESIENPTALSPTATIAITVN